MYLFACKNCNSKYIHSRIVTITNNIHSCVKLIITGKSITWCMKTYHSHYCTLQCNDTGENFYYFEVHLWTQWIFARCVVLLGNCAMCALNWKVWCEFSSGLLNLEFTLIPSFELNLKSYWHGMWLYGDLLGSAIICIL